MPEEVMLKLPSAGTESIRADLVLLRLCGI